MKETCGNCRFYINQVDGTGICAYPVNMRLLRVKESHRCERWKQTIAAAMKKERAEAR